MEVKFILLFILVLLFLGAWVFSNSFFAKKLIMSERLFQVTNIVLLICSSAGFVLTIIMGDEILTSHIFEILLIPALVAFVLTGLAHKSKTADEKFDEKQQSNMKDAASFSWMVVIFATFIIYAIYYAGNFSGLIFFPLLIYTAFTAYSGSLLYFYKNG